MPTYEYHCDRCDSNFDVVQSFHDDALTECVTCSSPVRKVFGNVGIVFKGSGFYKTDSRSNGSAKAAVGDAAAKSESSGSGSEASGSGSEASGSGSGAGTESSGSGSDNGSPPATAGASSPAAPAAPSTPSTAPAPASPPSGNHKTSSSKSGTPA